MLELVEAWLHRPNFIAFVILFLWGFYIMVTHHNLVKKLIGMYIARYTLGERQFVPMRKREEMAFGHVSTPYQHSLQLKDRRGGPDVGIPAFGPSA